MRLRQLRLSGFKTFVDATALDLRRPLTAIVGPNGCGKSNLIDAVAWVLGESSARHLRAELISEVIFSGSRNRQPAGQAGVELLLDNNEGRLGGRFLSYREVSIRRQVDREGVSSYFLNGTRCRRRDITALLHGTGLGPRGYAIIEQGMVSRLIDAGPDALRAHVEETAGISKYREDRREAEGRIRRAKENILNLSYLQDEVNKQIKELERQAAQAKRYRQLCDRERQLQGELLALDWQRLKERFQSLHGACQELELAAEGERSRLRHLEAELDRERQESAAFNRICDDLQGQFYRLHSEISRWEQNLKHGRERIAALEEESKRNKVLLAEEEAHCRAEQQELDSLEGQCRKLIPLREKRQRERERAQAALQETDRLLQEGQETCDRCSEKAGALTREEETARTRLEHLAARKREAERRSQELQGELRELDPRGHEVLLGQEREQLARVEREREELGSAERDTRRTLAKLRASVADLEQRLDKERAAHQEMHSALSSLQARQQAALGSDQEQVNQWLEETQLAAVQRLGERLQVAPRWRQAVELVLGRYLQAVESPSLEEVFPALDRLSAGVVGVYRLPCPAAPPDAKDNGLPPLLRYIETPEFPAGLLAGVFAAEHTEAALAARQRLQPGQSVVTPDGLWLGRDWLWLMRRRGDESILEREVERKRLQQDYAESRKRYRGLEEELAQLRCEAARQEAACQELRERLQVCQEAFGERHSRLAADRARRQQRQERAERIGRELEKLAAEGAAIGDEQEKLRQLLSSLQPRKEKLERERERLLERRQRQRDELAAARQRWQASGDALHETDLQLESLNSRKESRQRALKRQQQAQQQLAVRYRDLRADLEQARAPLAGWQERLQKGLEQRLQLERELQQGREKLTRQQESQQAQERQRAECENRLREQEAAVQQEQLAVGEARVRMEAAAERLTALDGVGTPEEVLSGLEEGADPALWQQRLDRIQRRIQQLGTVNLAAVEEHARLTERQQEQERQYEDLQRGLETLERAIRRIDREMRKRFQDTLEKLDGHLQDLFPRLFGGGQARLELIEPGQAESGVAIRARPPGKRGEAIHLLSGGEKALTAVALLFSIFRLNPAPLCLLDEVDAPLDDVNVGRFLELVRSMTDTVQFVFVTHNKISMEMADALLGVTMREPGISRIVSVDVGEAVELAATA